MMQGLLICHGFDLSKHAVVKLIGAMADIRLAVERYIASMYVHHR